jgi:hypothetical protein
MDIEDEDRNTYENTEAEYKKILGTDRRTIRTSQKLLGIYQGNIRNHKNRQEKPKKQTRKV